ncbi:GNAT family N-acetyltransferase [Streptomyces europaeiscabiei]|uniref:GNAT family N-acetyltransferase n=2 Tax=Streptomyces TaxID=1883 RepID=UPI0029AA05B4|nr:GNAT family N-acetyltransferase [Streptomyces europaeiscabiei]MDX3581223.1 GNAT family N-acetyltransferase [Streptomyces europaeiscabiei]MDX3615716.1 GNAT family N-acetyltransferase [Streptomyces europaeiscabiei]MDX3632620.1 GNAT family N-acetyltransferase [Streptomyces europaeiscabiei]MDX3653106.1 GNAT family N-acetyltransferase [Streptomyces europaeiscabiei]WUD34150.1 GNAT family N-acetyltransferase [Streptomyces europaeiscabiei]
MTDPVIRALSASDAHLFDALPDPLGAREGHRRTQFRPDWKRVALRDGEVVARGAWWGGPDDSEPVNINWFDVAEGEEEAGAELLRSAPWQVELEINLPGGWREKTDLRAAAEARSAAARAAGYELLVERFLYRWTPERGLPERPGRLRFSAEPDDTVFFDALRRIHSATLDGHALRAIEEGGLDQAAQEELDFFHWCPSPREWWQMAYTPEGDLAGIHIPAHNPSGPTIGFIGVVPEQRGRGYAYDLLAECTHLLVEQGAEFVSGATDQGNFPMAANFARAGFPVIRERINFHPAGQAA